MTQSHPENDHPEHAFSALAKSDAQLARFVNSPYTKPASPERIAAAKAGLEKNGFKVYVVKDRGQAFETLTSLIPVGASMGFITYLKGETPWDPVKQSLLRRTIGTSPDYYLTSMAAVTEDGKLAHADFSGSKVGGVAFGAANVIVVAGSNKIVKNEFEAHKRTHEFAYEGESARTRDVFKLPSSSVNRYEVIHKVQAFTPGRIQVVLVEEALGFRGRIRMWMSNPRKGCEQFPTRRSTRSARSVRSVSIRSILM
ncbi:hypothetical protein BG005_000941 [Podila minutissima]|nr:hypothetical protein BG005_000941 [Podila minutissima]